MLSDVISQNVAKVRITSRYAREIWSVTQYGNVTYVLVHAQRFLDWLVKYLYDVDLTMRAGTMEESSHA